MTPFDMSAPSHLFLLISVLNVDDNGNDENLITLWEVVIDGVPISIFYFQMLVYCRKNTLINF